MGAWNFGPQLKDALSVSEVVHMAIRDFKKGGVEVQEDNTRHEAMMLKLDNTKARKILDWHSQFDVSQAISASLQWYEVFYSDQNRIKEFTAQQIENYFRKVFV